MLVAGSLQLSAQVMKVTCCDGRTEGVMGIGLEEAHKYLSQAEFELYEQDLGTIACGKEDCERTVQDVNNPNEIRDMVK